MVSSLSLSWLGSGAAWGYRSAAAAGRQSPKMSLPMAGGSQHYRRFAEISVGQLCVHPAWRSKSSQTRIAMSFTAITTSLANMSLFIISPGASQIAAFNSDKKLSYKRVAIPQGQPVLDCNLELALKGMSDPMFRFHSLALLTRISPQLQANSSAPAVVNRT
jgi:hypothetical protein